MENLRRAIAQEAARIMAEHGIRDFYVAKRKAAERYGVFEGGLLPKNIEIEEALAERDPGLLGGEAGQGRIEEHQEVTGAPSRTASTRAR